MCLIDPKKSFWNKILYHAFFIFLPLFIIFWGFNGYFAKSFSSPYVFFGISIIVFYLIVEQIFRKILIDVEVHDQWVLLTYRFGFFKSRNIIFDYSKIDDIEYNQADRLTIKMKNHNSYAFLILNKNKLHKKILLLQRKFYEYTDLCNLYIPEEEARKSPNFELINRKEKVRDNRMFWLVTVLGLAYIILLLSYKHSKFDSFLMLLYNIYLFFFVEQCKTDYVSLLDIEFDGHIVKLFLKSGKVYQRICFEAEEVYRVNYEEKGVLHDGQLVIVFKDKDTMTIPVKLEPDNYLHDKIGRFSEFVQNKNELST